MGHGLIVTGTDGSESATAAVRQAAELAASSGAALHIVSAYPPADGAPGDAVRTILDTAEAALAGTDVPVNLHAEPGDPAGALCAVAERVGHAAPVAARLCRGADRSVERRGHRC